MSGAAIVSAGPKRAAAGRAAAAATDYMAQLDGIRAFAVGGVILEHYALGIVMHPQVRIGRRCRGVVVLRLARGMPGVKE